MSPTLILWLALGGVVLGVWLARRGLRGVAIDNHPCCGNCGYDLFNVAAPATCPECGSSPCSNRRIGNRACRPRMILLGLSLALMSTLVFGSMLWKAVSPTTLWKFAPLWMARVEARAGSQPAIDEIARRVRTGGLSINDLTEVADEALRCRHVDSPSLRAAWGDVIDASISSTLLDPGRIQRCLDEAVGVYWYGTSERFKDVSGNGIGTGISIDFAPAVGPRSTISFSADIESAKLDGIDVPVTGKTVGRRPRHSRSAAPGSTLISIELPAAIAGKQLTVHWRVRIIDANTGASIASDWVHTETISIPSDGDGFIFGMRSRTSQAGAPAVPP